MIFSSFKLVLIHSTLAYFFRYMEMFRELEFEIKAILLGKAIMNVDLPTYFRKRLLVVSDAVLKIL